MQQTSPTPMTATPSPKQRKVWSFIRSPGNGMVSCGMSYESSEGQRAQGMHMVRIVWECRCDEVLGKSKWRWVKADEELTPCRVKPSQVDKDWGEYKKKHGGNGAKDK